MAINFNPNLLPNDAPDDELIAQKMGALLLSDPDAFAEQPRQESDSNLDKFMDGLDDLFADYACEPVKPRKKKKVDG
ncbi:MAG TPA: hypothetical protein V6D11_20230 [Waterburya sp.]|jgi:hypothetical protein